MSRERSCPCPGPVTNLQEPDVDERDFVENHANFTDELVGGSLALDAVPASALHEE